MEFFITFFSRQVTQDFLVNVIGALVGVLCAFRLDRMWEKRQSKWRYASLLDACRYDLANLLSVCKQVRELFVSNRISTQELRAPALEMLLREPLLHEHQSILTE
jgi:uncharacterized membrane protein YccC